MHYEGRSDDDTIEKGGCENPDESDRDSSDDNEDQVTLKVISKTLNLLVRRVTNTENEIKFVKQNIVNSQSTTQVVKKIEVPLVIRVSSCQI